MGSVSRSPLFDSDQTEPLSTVLISDGGAEIIRRTMTADTANLGAGLLCYITGTTYPNDVTEAGKEHGAADQTIGSLWVVDIEASTAKLPTGYDNSTTYADGDPIQCIHLEIGMKFWAKGSTLTAAQGEILVTAAVGLVSNQDDASADAITLSIDGFRALTALTSGTWIPVQYIGPVGVDTA